MKITFISTYVPRKCGIATYCRDLVEEIQKQGNHVEIFAINNSIDKLTYDKIVTFKIEQQKKEDYIKAAELLNKNDSDIIHIQHEFGIFGGEDGEYILDFARKLKKPFVVTFHTTLKDPTLHQKEILEELNRLSRRIICLKEIGKDRLVNVYGFNERDIDIIFHGVPDVDGLEEAVLKKKLGLIGKLVLITSNLISRDKGIEYLIKALPDIIKKNPNTALLIIGETHPEVKKRDGEEYRKYLEGLVKELHLEKYVSFINKYLSLENLKEYFVASDIILTPYLDPDQVASGTLSYCIGAGKVCISTPYLYAKTMCKDGRGLLVAFRDEKAIAKSINYITSHSLQMKEIQKNAYEFGRQMRWDKIAKKHEELYITILKGIASLHKKEFLRYPLIADYLFELTDTIGILQHTVKRLKDKKNGYSTDDNARALIVATGLHTLHPKDQLIALMKVYLGFLFFAQAESGAFRTFLGPDSKWLDVEQVNDAYGKSVWALGFFLANSPDSPFALSVDGMFRRAISQVSLIRDIIAASFTILGLSYYYDAFVNKKDSAQTAYVHLYTLSDFLVKRFEENKTKDWQWFGKKITYDSFRLPQALFLAYKSTNNVLYKEVAEKSLMFLLSKNYNEEKKCFDFIGQNGWYIKGQKKADFDQQPLEAGGAVSSLVTAYTITKKKYYLEKAIDAFSWYFGNNINHVGMIDEFTKGIYDGLTPRGVNENQGSESIVCFLIAQLELQAVIKKG